MTLILVLSLSSIALGQSVEAFDPNANSPVYTVVLQADGKILIGGAFTSIGGFTGRFARINADGTLDPTFNPNVNPNNFPIFALAAQADGKVLVGGQGGVLARLNPNTGLRDTSFTTGSGTNGAVYALVAQADGKILVGGSFGFIGQSSQPRNNIARLNPDGTVDAFNPNAGGSVNTMAVQADGKILIGGFFVSVGGQPRNFIARLNPDGSLDPTFNPDANYTVDTLALQADGKILVGGQFTSIGGQPRNYFARLNPNGSLDTAFSPNSNGGVNTLALQADGKILVGGGFTSISGQPRTRFARLNADGTADSSFDINVNNGGAQSSVNALALQGDGKILVGGNFINIGGQPRNRIARLTNTGAASQTLSATATTVTWARGGTSPEIDRVTFESSPDGVNYTSLGNATRLGTTSDWQMTGLSLPSGNLYLRARGYQMASGQYGDSSAYEAVQLVNIVGTNTPPTITAGATATRQQSSWGTPHTIATVYDAETPLADLTVSVMSAPAGITIGSISAPDATTGAVTATITADCTATLGANTVALKVTDGGGLTATANLIVNVIPAPAPTITASGPTTFCQGGSVTLTASPADSYLWSNGATTQSITVATTGSYSVIVTNGNGCTGASAATTVTVNPLPAATVSGTTAICPGASAMLQVTLTGVGPWVLTWSDGFTQSVSSSYVTRTVSPATTTTYSITIVADANCSTAGSGSVVVTINPATAITAQPVSLTRNAGESATFSVTASGANLTYQWRKNGAYIGGATGSNYTIASVSVADAGDYDVVVTGACGAVTSNVAALTVSSNCVTPVVSITGPASGSIYPVGAAVNFSGAFTDASGGTHTATWTFDALPPQDGLVNESAGTVSGVYTFTQAGVYQVTLTVSNSCGEQGTANLIGGLTALVVVYDPNAGFVTGGGWINSPVGAYAPDPALTGKANFGFVSKYKKGNNVPEGQTEFNFNVANFRFHSTVYEWLVVSGARAQYKGSGKVNNAGDYRFILTAIDGQINGGGGQDKFRIRIWNNLGGGLVYDNQMNDPDSTDPITMLGGGQIVIHTGGNGNNLTAQSAQPTQAGNGPEGEGQNRDPEIEWQIIVGGEGEAQSVFWGGSGAPYFDVLASGDYDGDGATDLAIFRRANGHWLVKRSSDGGITDLQWGLGSDLPVAADYDGDGKTDIAVWRGATGQWFILRSSDGATQVVVWGASYAPYRDLPAPADPKGTIYRSS